MKRFALLIMLSLFYLNLSAEYRYMPLSALVCNADYGATGTIVKLDKNYFYLKVEAMILGDMAEDTLRIQRFEDWNCGRRYDLYRIGQKELVFFRKSNYVIQDFELLGYGAGGEFELPIRNDSIFYHRSYESLYAYPLKFFLAALRDFDVIKRRIKESGQPISEGEQKLFAGRSEFHKLLIDYKPYQNENRFKIPVGGYIVNLEADYLYQDYENKVYIAGVNMDSVFLSVEDADVWKQDEYFVVKPKYGWTRRWLNVYAQNDTGRTKVLTNQLFEIIELPEPRIYFDGYYRDTVDRRYGAIPTAAHYLDDLHQDKHLRYELLSYTYEISSNGRVETYLIKSARGTNELRERLSALQPGDAIKIKDIYVLYPNHTVKQIKGRTVYVGKDD